MDNDRPDLGAATDLVITRIFDAPRDLVFQAWSEPKYVSRWWGPHGFSAPFCNIDFRVGGSFHFCMRSPEGKDYWNKGVYQEIVVPTKIVATMYFSDQDGHRLQPSHYGMGADFPPEMLDVVTFEVHEHDKTRLTLRRNHSLEIAKRYREDEGWSQTLDRLAAALRAIP